MGVAILMEVKTGDEGNRQYVTLTSWCGNPFYYEAV